jgi:hypothetical protein
MRKRPSRQRDREQLMRDAVIAIGSNLTYGSKYALLDNICWTLSELDGKYEGCRYWSTRAIAQRTDLRHEHSVPRRVLIGLLLGEPAPSDEDVRRILDLCVGAVVTVEEDQALNAAGLRAKMPSEWDGQDVFARYRAAGVELVDTWQSLDARPAPLPRVPQSP